MLKKSQDRPILHRVKDTAKEAVESIVNKPVREKVIVLRKSDDELRSLISGKELGSGDFSLPEQFKGKSLLNLVDEMNTNLNRLEYINVISLLNDFHSRLSALSIVLEKTNRQFQGNFRQFLVDKTEKDKRKKLLELEQRLTATSSLSFNLIKEAGVFDWFHRHFSESGRMWKHWEKNNPQEAKELKADTSKIVSAAEYLVKFINNILKAMSTDLVKRNFSLYAKSCREILMEISKFNKLFVKYYEKTVKPLLEDLKKVEQEDLKKEKENEKIEEEKRKQMEDLDKSFQKDVPSKTQTKSIPDDFVSPIKTEVPPGSALELVHELYGKNKTTTSEYSEIIKGIRKLSFMKVK